MIHVSARIYGLCNITENSLILENVILGYPDRHTISDIQTKNIRFEDSQHTGSDIGDNALIRTNTVIYGKVRIGNNFQTGHNVTIRENTTIGDNVSVGTNTVIEGKTIIGNHVNLQSNVFIPLHTVIEDDVFLGPHSVLANDKYPASRISEELAGPVLRKGVSVGANATILPGVEIGEGSMVAAGAIVTMDVPAWKLAIGCPAKIFDLPDRLKVLNKN